MSDIEIKSRSNFWYILPIIFGIIGGIIAYFVLRKSDPSKARNCFLIGIGIVILGIVIGAISNLTTTDEEREKWATEREEKERQEMFERIAQKEKEAELEEQRVELDWQKQLEKQKELQADRLGGLPISCDGVVTTENYLYPTADQCVKDLTQGFGAWCLSEERKLAEKGAEARAQLCMADIAVRLVELCEDPVIGSQELCLMNSMQHLYKGMIQK